MALSDTRSSSGGHPPVPSGSGHDGLAPHGDRASRPDLPPRWPAVVRTELARRHGALCGEVADLDPDRVLDLSFPHGRHVLTGALSSSADAGRFDAVISVAGLTRFPDLAAALAAAVSLLRPAGRLLLVEPGYRPGPRGLAVSSMGALLPPARGVHLARDVPATVRAVGLTITDIRRFDLPTLVWPLRSFVHLDATGPAALAAGPGVGDDHGGQAQASGGEHDDEGVGP